ETGLYVSFDDGGSWQPLQRNLPATPITDLAVKDSDLVVATQGRSFWILDDLTPLRQWGDAIASSPAHLFPTRATTRVDVSMSEEEEDEPRHSGTNMPGGVIVSYWLQAAPKEKE